MLKSVILKDGFFVERFTNEFYGMQHVPDDLILVLTVRSIGMKSRRKCDLLNNALLELWLACLLALIICQTFVPDRNRTGSSLHKGASLWFAIKRRSSVCWPLLGSEKLKIRWRKLNATWRVHANFTFIERLMLSMSEKKRKIFGRELSCFFPLKQK